MVFAVREALNRDVLPSILTHIPATPFLELLLRPLAYAWSLPGTFQKQCFLFEKQFFRSNVFVVREAHQLVQKQCVFCLGGILNMFKSNGFVVRDALNYFRSNVMLLGNKKHCF